MTTPTALTPSPRRISHVAVPMLIVAIIVVMVVPLPAPMLDLLLATNISLAVVILLTGMMSTRALDFSVFPSLLLVTTLVRLSLNVSSTRLILSKGHAGKVIEAFGHVVVSGNLVIGLVIFIILVVIQFVVITAGAQRVAEVAARFTLDAMPGKQMAIDADLNSGLIDDVEARRRRSEVAREAEFYGAMDGASKFVKGDAIAAVIIVSINLVGGFAVGVIQMHMSISEAITRYSLLSVGDGLVSQVPALLISVAAGIVVTRVQSDDDGGLGGEVTAQLARSARALRISAGAVTLLGLMPGLPKIPFLTLAAVLFVTAARAPKAPKAAHADTTPVDENAGESTEALLETARVEPLEVELAPDLLDLIDPERGGNLIERVRTLRRRVAGELGIVVPPIRSRDSALLPSSTYVIRVHGVEVGRGEAPPGYSLVLGEDASHLPGLPTVDPVFRLPARWVRTDLVETIAGEATVIDRASVIVTHLAETIRSSAADLLSRQDVQLLVDAVKRTSPVVAGEIGPDGLTLSEVQRVLKDLLSESVPVRDLVRILEAVSARSRETRNIESLVEAARTALGPAITSAVAIDGRLAALSFDPLLEQSLMESVRAGDAGSWLALDAMRIEGLVNGIGDAVREAEQQGHRPAILCSSQMRPAIRRLVASGRPDLPVFAYHELARSLSVEPVGVIRLATAAAA